VISFNIIHTRKLITKTTKLPTDNNEVKKQKSKIIIIIRKLATPGIPAPNPSKVHLK